MGRNFCNKLWNAARFALMNLDGAAAARFDAGRMRLEDRWVLSRCEQAARATGMALEAFHFQAGLMILYEFFWNELCDWYLEAIKPRLSDSSERATAQRVLAFVLDRALRLLHPFVPFITEAAWEGLNEVVPERGLAGLAAAPASARLIAAAWPAPCNALLDEAAEAEFRAAQDVVRTVRDIRSKFQVAPSALLRALVRTSADEARAVLQAAPLICRMAGLEALEARPDAAKPDRSAAEVVAGAEVYVPLAGLIDLDAERRRLADRIAKERRFLEGLEKKLANQSFVEKAPAEVVERERARADGVRQALAALEKNLADLD
jgi:valyl-tRNA synthetase